MPSIGIEGALEHVVLARELPGLLDRDDVTGVLDHADRRGVPPVVGADGAQPALGHVEAAGAEGDPLLHRHDGLGQPEWRPRAPPADRWKVMRCADLGPMPGQAAQLVDEGLQRPREDGHLASPLRHRERPGAPGGCAELSTSATSPSSDSSKAERSSTTSASSSGRPRRKRPAAALAVTAGPGSGRTGCRRLAGGLGGRGPTLPGAGDLRAPGPAAPLRRRGRRPDRAGRGSRSGRTAHARPRGGAPRTGCGGSRWAGRTGAAVHGAHEPAGLEQRFGLRSQPPDDVVTPGLHQLVAVGERAARRARPRRVRRGGPAVGGFASDPWWFIGRRSAGRARRSSSLAPSGGRLPADGADRPARLVGPGPRRRRWRFRAGVSGGEASGVRPRGGPARADAGRAAAPEMPEVHCAGSPMGQTGRRGPGPDAWPRHRAIRRVPPRGARCGPAALRGDRRPRDGPAGPGPPRG